MQVLANSRHPQASELRHLTGRRLRFVLRRLGGFVPRAGVHLSGMNGTLGSIDKRCQVGLRTGAAGSTLVALVAKDL